MDRVLTPMTWLLLLLIGFGPWCTNFAVGIYPLGPNHYLGTCLDSAWVTQMETQLGISSKARDTSGRLLHPFLQPALKYSRYRVDDHRTASGAAFTDACMATDYVFYGADQDADGKNRGNADGTLVLDVGDWDTHWLSSLVTAILAEEVTGYKVSISVGGAGVNVTQRMSSAWTGICTPTHFNAEVWSSSILSELRVYSNESYLVGGIGYFGLSGLYTTHQFVLDGAAAAPPYFPGFWMHYKMSNTLINQLSVASFKADTKYYPPAKKYCEDGTLGCQNHCSKSKACTDREAANGQCLVVAMMTPFFDQAYFQAVLSNLDIPAYFCFIGYGGVNKYAADAAAAGKPVLFYHYEPDLFHIKHKGEFDRVFLPRTDPERVKLSTGKYGENGYGGKTVNPVDVDYPSLPLTKFAASIVKGLPAGSLFAKLTLTDTDINTLMSEYLTASKDNTEPSPYFRAACNWVKENYEVWSNWIDRLPLCSFEEHIINRVTGCGNDSSVRNIEFAWKSPDPGNATLPNNCDGGVSGLPETIATSRSCDWIFDNRRTWTSWIDSKPTCDPSFYNYSVSECDSDAFRTVEYFWKLPNASNPQNSAECSDGDKLPETITIDCEYMPTTSPAFAAMTVFATIVAVLLTIAIFIVIKNRNAPIIRRSQYEMLLLMIFGGFFTTGAAVAYAGRPTKALCGLRPVLVCMGFTTIFGSLVIKSLRVYRVFMKSAMKRVKVTLLQILKILSIFYVGDIVIFIAWYAADFPEPTITTEDSTEFRGTVDRISCSSSSFIFTALLIFWKAILLMIGLYLSFLIRNVSVDFQESPWIFGSVVVVLAGCLLIMPMSYLVKMRASTYYVFLACTLLLCMVLIMCLMLVPKLFRLKDAASSKYTSSSASGASGAGNSAKSRNSLVAAAKPQVSNLTNVSETGDDVSQDVPRKTSQKYQVRPLQNGNPIAGNDSSTGDAGTTVAE
ncbi:Gamma-aminobutyric acid type B receptor subunit 2 [Phytophthora citrophthora]|uniref:Gamma-aminobutyric acid type B receptor subunit 2 n=1 Tax=Phytophthora citrophthora TaxID=4793 RepID=A0AAD9GA56_9STRA|nr:Gamma-aminobutyric acid type B receptor subunit 2 [Phytophthora citrophthora]